MLELLAESAPPHVVAALADAEPLGDVVQHRFPANRRRRYARLSRFPAGLLVFGDALCSFNPIYGQGMSVASMQALALRNCLRRGSGNLAQRFFKAAGKPIDVALETRRRCGSGAAVDRGSPPALHPPDQRLHPAAAARRRARSRPVCPLHGGQCLHGKTSAADDTGDGGPRHRRQPTRSAPAAQRELARANA